MNVAKLFYPRPETWGLRGDPHLWDDMLETLMDTPVPVSPTELSELIKRTFRQLTGVDMATERDHFYLEKYEGSGGGMSKGMISVDFWCETALPLLIDRMEKATAKTT